MPLVGGADPNGTASGDPIDLRFNRPYRASPTGLSWVRQFKNGQLSDCSFDGIPYRAFWGSIC
eukprot:3728833-Pleurochrysis_carterae.AAC.1